MGADRTPGVLTARRTVPPVAIFVGTALAFALTAGFGLGLWLMLARTHGLSMGGTSWLAAVQVHGVIQLFGFAGLFVMGVGLHLFPRLRAADPPGAGRQLTVYGLAVSGLLLRAVAQPLPGLPARDLALGLSALLLVAAALLYAGSAVAILARGRNPHRPDEIAIGAGAIALPIAALLATAAVADGWPLVAPPEAQDRATWTMLLGAAATTILGVWARLAPPFVAARPIGARTLLLGIGLWIVGVAGVAARWPLGPACLLAGLTVLVVGLGLWGPTIARQRLEGHALLTRLAMRSAFGWALVGAALLALAPTAALPAGEAALGSAARHAFGLGLVTLAIYGVASRALPAFLGLRLWSPRAQLVAIVLTNAAVALRVVPEALAMQDELGRAALALSGALAYVGLLAFALNLVRTLRGRRGLASTDRRGGAVPIVFR